MSDQVGNSMEAFIAQEMREFAQYLYEQARLRLVARNIRVNDELLQSLATEAAGSELQMSFVDHGRFHDMGAGRGYHKGKFMGPAERAEFLKGRKPSNWYSRLAWGAVYGTLVNNLSNKYIAEVPGLITGAYDRA